MHVCFHGGAGDSKITKSVSIIRGFTKNVRTSICCSYVIM